LGFIPTTVSGQTVYQSTSDDLSVLQVKDLLLFSNNDELLLQMADRDFDESLWKSDAYQQALNELGPKRIFYEISFRDLEDSSGMFGALSDGTVYRSLGLQAQVEGLRADAFTELGRRPEFDSAAPYLYKEINGGELMAYFETYDLAAQIRGNTRTYDSMQKFFTSYFSMDFAEEVEPFLKRGAALAVFTSKDSFFPGLTLSLDVSDDPEAAQEWLLRLDDQLSSVVNRFSTEAPGSMTRGTVATQDGLLNQIHIDFEKLNLGGAESLAPDEIPATLTLTYGIEGDRLIVNTYEAEDGISPAVSAGALYQSLQEYEQGDGLILFDPQLASDSFDHYMKLRSFLDVAASDSPWVSPEILGFLDGVIFGRELTNHGVHWQGFLKLKHE
jgi:hypothetical protein